MKSMTQQNPWLAWQYPGWLCVLRMALGIFITFKTLFYMLNIADFESMPSRGLDPLIDLMFIHMVVFIHFVGGIFITFGYMTRIAVILQLPIVLGALIFINSGSRLLIGNAVLDIAIATTTLLLLILFLILGSGEHSIDHRFKVKKELKIIRKNLK